jgi:hypothetical protein
MIFVVVSLVVLAKRNLDPAPHELDGFSVVPGVRMMKLILWLTVRCMKS